MKFVSQKQFDSLDPAAKYREFKKYIIWAAKVQVIICLGVASPFWVFYYFFFMNFNDVIAIFSLSASFISFIFAFIFPTIWDYYKPEWSESYIKYLTE